MFYQCLYTILPMFFIKPKAYQRYNESMENTGRECDIGRSIISGTNDKGSPAFKILVK